MREWLKQRLWERKWKREGKRFGEYPPCDHLNCALACMLNDPLKNKKAIEEICYAIVKARGYYYAHVANDLVRYGFGMFVTEEMVHE